MSLIMWLIFFLIERKSRHKRTYSKELEKSWEQDNGI